MSNNQPQQGWQYIPQFGNQTVPSYPQPPNQNVQQPNYNYPPPAQNIGYFGGGYTQSIQNGASNYDQGVQNVYQVAYPQQVEAVIHQAANQDGNNSDVDDNNYASGTKLSDLSTSARVGFIKKVYFIFTFLILVTAATSYYAVNNAFFQAWLANHQTLIIVLLVLTLPILCCLVCSPSLARSVPINYVLMGVFAFGQSLAVAATCASIQNSIVVYQAFAMTVGVYLALTLYAAVAKQDFTTCGGALTCFFAVLLIAGFFIGQGSSKTTLVIYAALSALAFAGSTLMSTQLIIGGRSQKYSIDDYIIATIDIYTDFIGLFLRILQILALSSKDN